MSTHENAFVAAADSLGKVRTLILDGQELTGRMASLADQADRAAARIDAQLAEHLARFDGQVDAMLSKQHEACSAVNSITSTGVAQIAAEASRSQEMLDQTSRAIEAKFTANAERVGAAASALEATASASSAQIGMAAAEAVSKVQSAVEEFNLAAATQSERQQQFANLVKASVLQLKKVHEDSASARQEIAAFSREIQELGTKLAARQLAMVVAVGGLCVLTLVAIVLQIVVIVKR